MSELGGYESLIELRAIEGQPDACGMIVRRTDEEIPSTHVVKAEVSDPDEKLPTLRVALLRCPHCLGVEGLDSCSACGGSGVTRPSD